MKADDEKHMQTALDLARKGYGRTSPNPMVGAVLVKGRAVIGKGWHRRAGGPHAEVEAIRDAERHDYNVKGATLYVTLEPCTMCCGALVHARVETVIFAAREPRSGAVVSTASLLDNPALNHRVAWNEGLLGDESALLLRQFFQLRRDAATNEVAD